MINIKEQIIQISIILLRFYLFHEMTFLVHKNKLKMFDIHSDLSK